MKEKLGPQPEFQELIMWLVGLREGIDSAILSLRLSNENESYFTQEHVRLFAKRDMLNTIVSELTREEE